jgi:hypothetical protein
MARKMRSGGNTNKFSFDKTKKYKYNSSGTLVEFTGDAGADDITMSGSKSSLRRMADVERNVSILAAKLLTNDGESGDSDDSNFGRIETKAIRFKDDIRMDDVLDMRSTIDMNTNKITDLGTPTASADAANKSYVDTKVASLADSAPAALDTLNELAAAMGDDANFSTTVTNSIATKMPLAGGAFSGAVTTNSTFDGRDVATDGAKLDGIESGANVTDAANVTAAGALMDSELAGIAHVKSLNQGLTTSSSPSFTAVTATNFNGEATTAKYADLAERYSADAVYEEGTVVMFGGDMEVTASHGYGSMKIAGVVSMKPAFAMNEEAGSNDTHPYIALQGRVPCKVMGDVSKGDILVASDDSGVATKWMDADSDPRMTAYIGIAISDAVDGMVEVKVGK